MVESPAIQQARARLQKLRDATQKLMAAGASTEAENAWSDILLSLSGIYAKLEQGSKVSGTATAWFGRTKKERKDDPLLRYAHHARNADEHSVQWTTQKLGPGIGIVNMNGGSFVAQRNTQGGYDMAFCGGPGTNPPNIISFAPGLEMLTVTDARYGDIYDPPGSHFGVPIADRYARTVAPMLCDYAEKMIEAALYVGI